MSVARVQGFVLVFVTLAIACADDDPNVCTRNIVATPTGSIRWTDGVVRLPDRVYLLHEGYPEPRECAFHPPQPGVDAIAYSCHEGPEGPATLSVLLDDRHWDAPFRVGHDGCHAIPITIDLELDPAAGGPF